MKTIQLSNLAFEMLSKIVKKKRVKCIDYIEKLIEQEFRKT